jgi:hypothetical protein
MEQANNGSQVPSYNVMLVHYFQDCGSITGSCPSAQNATGNDSIRDAGVQQISYGSGTTNGTISSTDGTVDFHYWAQYVGSGQSQ